MALIIPTGYSQVTIPFNHVSSAREAVITFGVFSASWGGSFPGLADSIQVDWEESMAQNIDSEVVIGPTRLSVGQDGGEALAVSGTTFSNGLATMTAVASNTAVLVKKLSARGGRRGRGRFYVPWCVADGAVSEIGIITGGTVGDIQTDATSFLGKLTASDHGMVLLHNTGISSPGSPDAVTSLLVDNLVGTQRRRLGR